MTWLALTLGWDYNKSAHGGNKLIGKRGPEAQGKICYVAIGGSIGLHVDFCWTEAKFLDLLVGGVFASVPSFSVPVTGFSVVSSACTSLHWVLPFPVFPMKIRSMFLDISGDSPGGKWNN